MGDRTAARTLPVPSGPGPHDVVDRERTWGSRNPDPTDLSGSSASTSSSPSGTGRLSRRARKPHPRTLPVCGTVARSDAEIEVLGLWCCQVSAARAGLDGHAFQPHHHRRNSPSLTARSPARPQSSCRTSPRNCCSTTRAGCSSGLRCRASSSACDYDPELLYVGAMFHDVGLLEGHRSERRALRGRRSQRRASLPRAARRARGARRDRVGRRSRCTPRRDDPALPASRRSRLVQLRRRSTTCWACDFDALSEDQRRRGARGPSADGLQDGDHRRPSPPGSRDKPDTTFGTVNADVPRGDSCPGTCGPTSATTSASAPCRGMSPTATTMQAITVRDRAAGVAGLSLADMPYPHAAENDVIVRVHAAGFTPGELDWPSTWCERAGRDRTPSVPGHELSRVVAELGYGTTGLTVRQRVFGLVNWAHNGSLAEYVALETRDLAPLPADADHAMAAALPISGLTAWRDRAQARRACLRGSGGRSAGGRRCGRPSCSTSSAARSAIARRSWSAPAARWSPSPTRRKAAIAGDRRTPGKTIIGVTEDRGAMRITIRLALIAVRPRDVPGRRTGPSLRFAGPPPAVRHRP